MTTTRCIECRKVMYVNERYNPTKCSDCRDKQIDRMVKNNPFKLDHLVKL